MPAKKKEPKVEEPVFVDEEGHFIHEKEMAKYEGGIRRYVTAAASQESGGGHGGGGGAKSSKGPGGKKEDKKVEEDHSADACIAVLRHGRGTYSSPTLQYAGDWQEDVMEGTGTLRFLITGSCYTGEFRRGRFDGHGTYTWADGSSYNGHWRGNRMHGEGVYIDAQGAVWKGQFFNGTGPGLDRVYRNTALRPTASTDVAIDSHG